MNVPGYDENLQLLQGAGVPFTIHEHEPFTTYQEMGDKIPFPMEAWLKTMAFRVKDSFWILAGIRAPDRVDYKKLAALFEVKRGNIMAGSPEEIAEALGQEIGGVGPLSSRENVKVVIDQNLLPLGTVYCGMGRRDITLEILLKNLIEISNAQIEAIIKDG
ncbi:MAG: YbaK/EbsC family protein [Chloroflexi bacterium]|nr:YbaK/EbsC family protein [Chloroflexota bacterium]